MNQLGDSLVDADVVVTCTGAGAPIITSDLIAGRPAGRPLHIVDIAVPRDVDSAVTALDGVTVLDLDDLRDWADRGRGSRTIEANRVRSIVAEEVEAFIVDLQARQAAPLVASIRQHADDVRAAELERYTRRLGGLSDADRETVEALTRSLVAKLLHGPSVRLKQDAGTPRGERNAAAVRDLFDLG